MISDSLLLITWPVKVFPLLIQADWLDMALLPRPDLGFDVHTHTQLHMQQRIVRTFALFVCLFEITQFLSSGQK